MPSEPNWLPTDSPCQNCKSAQRTCLVPEKGTSRGKSCQHCRQSRVKCSLNDGPSSRKRRARKNDDSADDDSDREDSEESSEDVESDDVCEADCPDEIRVDFPAATEIENRYLSSTRGLDKVINNTKAAIQRAEDLVNLVNGFAQKMSHDVAEQVLHQTLAPLPASANLSRLPHQPREPKASSSGRPLSPLQDSKAEGDSRLKSSVDSDAQTKQAPNLHQDV